MDMDSRVVRMTKGHKTSDKILAAIAPGQKVIGQICICGRMALRGNQEECDEC